LPAVFANLPWDHAGDLVPVTMYARTPHAMVVHSQSRFKSLADALQYARANPGKVTFGHSGAGTTGFVLMQQMMRDAKVNLTHVSFKSGAEVLGALMSNSVDLSMRRSSLSRRDFVGAAAASAGLLLGSRSLAQTAATGTLRPVKMMTSLPTLTSAATYLMKAGNLDAARGLNVELLQTGGSSSLQIDGVLSRNADFGFPGTATALQAIREGADLRILGAIANNQITAVVSNEKLKSLGVAPTAPIADRIRALKGMTIGTNPVGATYYQMLRAYLKQYGLNPDTDVRLVGIAESSALISGIQQGRFDAICSASGIVEQAISLKAGTLWFSGARGDIPGSDRSMVAVMITRGETVQKEPALVEAARAAVVQSLKSLNEDRAATGRLLQEKFFNKLDPVVWDMVWEGAKAAYPAGLVFPRIAYDFWIDIDPKGTESFKAVDYRKITHPVAQGA